MDQTVSVPEFTGVGGGGGLDMNQTVSVPEFTGVGGLIWIRLYQFEASLWCRGLDMDQIVSVPEFTLL